MLQYWLHKLVYFNKFILIFNIKIFFYLIQTLQISSISEISRASIPSMQNWNVFRTAAMPDTRDEGAGKRTLVTVSSRGIVRMHVNLTVPSGCISHPLSLPKRPWNAHWRVQSYSYQRSGRFSKGIKSAERKFKSIGANIRVDRYYSGKSHSSRQQNRENVSYERWIM